MTGPREQLLSGQGRDISGMDRDSNNSGSIKIRAVKFVYSRGFSAMADRIVWLPSLSCDQKWQCLPTKSS